jgi:hypothetical protein
MIEINKREMRREGAQTEPRVAIISVCGAILAAWKLVTVPRDGAAYVTAIDDCVVGHPNRCRASRKSVCDGGKLHAANRGVPWLLHG